MTKRHVSPESAELKREQLKQDAVAEKPAQSALNATPAEDEQMARAEAERLAEAKALAAGLGLISFAPAVEDLAGDHPEKRLATEADVAIAPAFAVGPPLEFQEYGGPLPQQPARPHDWGRTNTPTGAQAWVCRRGCVVLATDPADLGKVACTAPDRPAR